VEDSEGDGTGGALLMAMRVWDGWAGELEFDGEADQSRRTDVSVTGDASRVTPFS
jgi:hypothetical protein